MRTGSFVLERRKKIIWQRFIEEVPYIPLEGGKFSLSRLFQPFIYEYIRYKVIHLTYSQILLPCEVMELIRVYLVAVAHECKVQCQSIYKWEYIIRFGLYSNN